MSLSAMYIGQFNLWEQLTFMYSKITGFSEFIMLLNTVRTWNISIVVIRSMEIPEHRNSISFTCVIVAPQPFIIILQLYLDKRLTHLT